MLSLLSNLMPLILGVMLTWAGATKLLVKSAPGDAIDPAWRQVLGHTAHVSPALRVLAWVEFVVGLCLLGVPTAPLPALAAAVLGACFLAALAYARGREPDGSAAAAAGGPPPVTRRALARAAMLVAGGLVAAGATTPWWMVGSRHPVASVAAVLVIALIFAGLDSELDHLWLVPLRAERLRRVARREAVEAVEAVEAW